MLFEIWGTFHSTSATDRMTDAVNTGQPNLEFSDIKKSDGCLEMVFSNNVVLKLNNICLC